VGKQADRILPMTLTLISGDAMAALVMAAGLAALMSTMDSQLLTLSSIFTHDIAPLARKQQGPSSVSGRIFVICLSLAGLALAYNPPATILQIATQTFTGLAVLFPTVIFGLYLKKVYAPAAVLSILCGEGALVLFYLKWISIGVFLPVVWVMIVTFSVYLATHALLRWKERAFSIRRPRWMLSPYFFMLGGIFVLSMDFWAWGRAQPAFMGIPLWLGYFILLSAVQTAVMLAWVKAAGREGVSGGG
jgi:SSS family solute:Na+ symporter